MKTSIALIGFMATGKSTIGKALKIALGENYQFIETDQLIIEMAGKSIPRIFSEDGEEQFREYERLVCEKLSLLNRKIISCGGGLVLNNVNIENLKKNCHIVLLKATIEEIYKRAMKDGTESRPVINKSDPLSEIKKNLKIREQLYENAAEVIIDTTNRSIAEIAAEIINKTKVN